MINIASHIMTLSLSALAMCILMWIFSKNILDNWKKTINEWAKTIVYCDSHQSQAEKVMLSQQELIEKLQNEIKKLRNQ